MQPRPVLPTRKFNAAKRRETNLEQGSPRQEGASGEGGQSRNPKRPPRQALFSDMGGARQPIARVLPRENPRWRKRQHPGRALFELHPLAAPHRGPPHTFVTRVRPLSVGGRAAPWLPRTRTDRPRAFQAAAAATALGRPAPARQPIIPGLGN